MLSFITWDIDPEAINILGKEIRWYGICWATGVFLTSFVVQRMYKFENLPEKWFDKLFSFVLVGLLLGARLGHCLFYSPSYYLSHPLEILKVWEGGLASHGGAIGMTIGVCMYSLSITNATFNWKHAGISSIIGAVVGTLVYFVSILIGFEGIKEFASVDRFMMMGLLIGFCISFIYTTRETTIATLDRLVVGVAIGATLIRIGNLMNSEVYGKPTEMPWGFNFVGDRSWYDPIAKGGADQLPCHPTMLYEALVYLFLFALGMFLFYKTNARQKKGLILGILLIGIFLFRFFVEYLKLVQVDFELLMRDTVGIDMGQFLSLPFIIWGVYLVWNALRSNKKIELISNNKTLDNVKTNKNKK